MYYYNIFSSNETWISARLNGCNSSLILQSYLLTSLANKLQLLIHYLIVLSFMVLWIIVLIISPQVLVGSCSVPFVINCMLKLIRIYTIHLYSISMISLGTTLALIVLFLVWQPVSLQNTAQVYVLPCWWSLSSCNAYQTHSMMLRTLRWLISYT